MDKERLHRVKAAMETAGFDALVCRLPENVLLLSGHWPLVGWSFLFFPIDGTPLCVVPHCDEREARDELWEAECVSYRFGVLDAGDPYEDIARALKDAAAGRPLRRVGVEGSFETVAPPWNAAEPAVPAGITRGILEDVFGKRSLADAGDLLDALRSRKTPAEQKKLKRANEIAVIGLEAFHEKADIGVSGVELVAHVEHTLMTRGTGYKGARRVRAFAQVSTGADETVIAYRPMVISTSRRMQAGDLAVLELAVVADGFWCDRTRVRVAGAPTDQQCKVFQTVRKAQEAAIATIRPSVKTGEVDKAARQILRDAGYDNTAFLHVTGHGLGFRYHEPIPLICPGGETLLEDGMLHTVEPGIYIDGMGGIRLEENVLVTVSGSEVLGPCRKALSE